MKIKVIENDKEHREALDYLIALVENSPEHCSEELIEEMKLRGILIENYEKKRFPLFLDPPVAAARVSKIGLRQVVQIPAKYRFGSKRVTVRKENESLVLTPV